MYLRWRRFSAARPVGLPGEEPLHAAWQVVYDGFAHTAARRGDDDTAKMLRTQLGDTLYSFSLALVREAALRRRCRELEDMLASRGEP